MGITAAMEVWGPTNVTDGKTLLAMARPAYRETLGDLHARHDSSSRPGRGGGDRHGTVRLKDRLLKAWLGKLSMVDTVTTRPWKTVEWEMPNEH